MKLSRLISNAVGVTLIEILIVTAIIGIGAELVAYNVVSQMPKYRVEGAARRIALDLMQSRASAINQSFNVAVLFKADAREYDIWTDANFNGAQDSGEVVPRDLRDDFPGTTVVATADPTFNPQGFANAGITITLSTGDPLDPLNPNVKQVQVSLAGTVQVE